MLLESSVQECIMHVICSEWAKTCRNTGLILHRRGQTEQLLWQHRGWQTFESPPDAVCLLWCSCYCTLVAPWSIAGSALLLCICLSHWLLLSFIIHACTVTWHFSLFFPPAVSPLPWNIYSYFSPAVTSLTLSAHYPVFSLSHLGDLLPLRRQEAVCGYAGEAADGHRCEEDVRAVRQHRGVHGAPRAWWYQQR